MSWGVESRRGSLLLKGGGKSEVESSHKSGVMSQDVRYGKRYQKMWNA